MVLHSTGGGSAAQGPRTIGEATRAVVIGALLVLTWLAGYAPFIQRPSGLPPSVGPGTFQVMVAAMVGVASLIVLVFGSYGGTFWTGFLRPASYRRGVLQSLAYVGAAIAGEVIIFILMLALGFPSFYSNTAPGPVVLALQEWLHGLTAAVAVGGAVLLARGLILSGIAFFSRWR
jgi:hypothetical protein